MRSAEGAAWKAFFPLNAPVLPIPRCHWRAMRSRPYINRSLASGSLRPDSSNKILHGRDVALGNGTDIGHEV